MKSIAIASLFVVSLTGQARADCQLETSLGGDLGAHQYINRGFTLRRGATLITVQTDLDGYVLSFAVNDPNGNEVCSENSKARLVCAVQVDSDSEGLYRIHIDNRSGSHVSYQMSCANG